MQALALENRSSSHLTLDNFTSTRDDQYDLLARLNAPSKTLSMNFREILVNEVLTSMHIDLAEDLLRVIDLYMYGKNQCFVFHERQSRDLQVLSLDYNILESLTPCNANIYSKVSDNVIQMLVGRKLLGFDICENDDDGDPNPLEIMTDKDSIFLVPDEPANWWFNRDSKFMDLPAYSFNHRIEDARVIIRTTGPYLQLLVSRCDNGGFRKCSNLSLSSDCLSEDNQSIVEDPIATEFFRCHGSSQENTMVFLSPRIPSLLLEESHSTVSEHLNLPEQNNEVGDIYASQSYSPTSRSLGNSLHCDLDSWRDSYELDTCSKPDGPILQDHIHSREITPELITSDLDIDVQSVYSLNDLSKARRSRRTVKAKTHVLELGAGLLRKHDRSISFMYNRTARNPNYGVSNIHFCNNFDALASV